MEFFCSNSKQRLLIRKDSDDNAIIQEVLNSDVYGLKEHKNKPIRRVLDLGGHIGSFAVKATETWPNAQIFSFEPCPVSSLLFRINTNQFPNITSFEEAASPVKEKKLIIFHLTMTAKKGIKKNQEEEES